MKEILLNKFQKVSRSYRKYSTMVDDEDFESLNKYAWSVLKCDNIRYAVANINGKMKLMHRLLTGFKITDHIDGNGLNNQKSNLREATFAENCRNRKPRKDSSSGYKGVHLQGNRWRAKIRKDSKVIHLGYFDTAEKAAERYNRAALKEFGEFAWLNTIKQQA